MKNHRRSRANALSKKTVFALSGLGFSGWAIVVLSVAIVTFLGSMFLNRKESYQGQGSYSTVTLQILNGCGQRGASAGMADALLPGDGTIIYDVIEKTDAEFDSFEKTVVVDRRGSPSGSPSEMSRHVASRMGIEDEDIVILRLADNILDIDVTVIAGGDYMKYIDKLNRLKEAAL